MPPRRWLGWGILVLVALPALAVALNPLVVHAEAHAAGVQVHVEAGDQPLSAYVVVHHDDPLLGPVVDRLVPLAVIQGGGVNVSLDQLRDDVDMTVDLIPRDALDALVGEARGVVNGTKLPTIPPLSRLDVGTLRPRLLPYNLYAYPYLDSQTNLRHPRVLLTPDGVLGVAYLVSPFTNGAIAQPYLRVSLDGGHRFGEPILLDRDGLQTDPSQGSNDGVFDGVVGADGSLVFVTAHDDQNRTLQNWTVTRVDPLPRERVVRVFDRPAGLRLTNYSPLVFGNGSVLLVNHGPLPDQAGGSGPAVLRFDVDGSLIGSINLETQSNSSMASDEVWARATGAGSAAVVWRTTDISRDPTAPSHRMNLRYATTFDGGATWTTPRTLLEFPAAQGMEASLALDELGVLHLVANAHWGDALSNLYYARIAPGQDPVASNLTTPAGPIRLAAWSYVAAAGGRAWILGGVAQTIIQGDDPHAFAVRYGTWAWESLPDPLGLRPAHEFRVAQTQFSFEGRPSLMPDGRMVVPGRSSGGYVVVPTFDPFPEPGCAVHDPSWGSGTPTPGTDAASASPSCPDQFSFQVVPGLSRVDPWTAAPRGDGPTSNPFGRFPSVGRAGPGAVAGSVAAVGTAALVGLLFTDAARVGTGLAGARLFARMRGKAVLQHAIRGGIHDHIQANPGIRFNRLRRELGLSHGATAYHLRVLQRNGLVRQHKSWTTRRYYPLSAALPAPSPEARDVILDFIRRHPQAGASEVARHLGLSRQLAHYHLRRLSAARSLPSKR